ncbi:MAG: SRPBCC domain-containing protein [Pseudomonadota bacterium]
MALFKGEVDTRLEIAAPVSRVWELVSQVENYGRWNPFVVMGRGTPVLGGFITVRAQPSKKVAKTFTPKITRLEPERELRWLGHFLFPGLVDGEHIHELVPLSENRTLYVHRDEFVGLLLPLVWPRLERVTRMGFIAMNEALKQEAEKGG